MRKSGVVIGVLIAAGLGFGVGVAVRGPSDGTTGEADFALPGLDLASRAGAEAGPGSVRHSAVVDVARSVSPGVVAVGRIVVDRWFSPFSQRGRRRVRDEPYVGSGLIVLQKSLLQPGDKALSGGPNTPYVLTNYHVVADAPKTYVMLPDGRTFDARVMGADPVVDVALLELLDVGSQEIPTVTLGDSDDIMLGESAVALGNPFGILINDPHPTVTVGVISGVDRSFQFEGSSFSAVPNRVYQDMIQTDAAVNPGNSGGPLINFDKEVIGINTFIIAPGGGSAGINFAIPINRAITVAREILKYGEVRSLALDFRFVALSGRYSSDYWKRAGIEAEYGLVIIEIFTPRGSAARAGLQEADVIIAVGGREVHSRRDFLAKVMAFTAGEKLELTVMRGSETLELEYEIPAAPGE